MMIMMMSYSDEWSPTGFVARLKLDKSPTGEYDNAIVTWGANGEPLVHGYYEQDGTMASDRELTDASKLPHFRGIDIALYRGTPFAAAPGWSVEITHPDGTTETRPVGAWLQNGPEVAPMVPGTGEFAGALVYVGQDYAFQASHSFRTKLIPPKS